MAALAGRARVPRAVAADGRYAADAPWPAFDAARSSSRCRGRTAVAGPGGRRSRTGGRRRSGAPRRRETSVARYAIAADGMWSPVRKSLGVSAPGYLGEWHAFRQYASNVTGPAAERLIVWFEADLLPGYAWSFPFPGNRVNIGFGVLRDGDAGAGHGRPLAGSARARPHVVDALGADFELEGRHTAWPIPARIDGIAHHGPVLFVGDAAAASDVMTGEGIGQALLTGRLAAKAIIAGGASHPTSSGTSTSRSCATICLPTTACPRCSAACSPTDVGRRSRSESSNTAGRGAAQLRPMDVRGRATRDRLHADTLASRPAAPPRRLGLNRTSANVRPGDVCVGRPDRRPGRAPARRGRPPRRHRPRPRTRRGRHLGVTRRLDRDRLVVPFGPS